MKTKMQTLEELFVYELRDLLSAEHQILKALPKMAKAASHPELRTAFEGHLRESQEHINRLEQVLEQFGGVGRTVRCAGMEGLLNEGKKILDADGEGSVIDAALIAIAQKVEHYEIACYGCVRTWANQLGFNEAQQTLRQTLNEEKMADTQLNQLAQEMINAEAAEVGAEFGGEIGEEG